MTLVSLWLLFKVLCIVIAIPQNLGDFQVNTPSQSPHSSKLYLQDDQVSQSQLGDCGRLSETFESFQREMEARLRAQEAKSARQEQLLAKVLENFGHRLKESEETFERFRKEMEENLENIERESRSQEIKMLDLMGRYEDRERKIWEMSDAFEIIIKHPELSDLIQRSKMGASPGKIHYLYDILCLRHLFNWSLCFEDFFNLLIKKEKSFH